MIYEVVKLVTTSRPNTGFISRAPATPCTTTVSSGTPINIIHGIYHVYTMYIPCIYLEPVYTWYIPYIYMVY